jgi:hypothetical protein
MYPFITAIWVEVQFSGFWEHALYPGLWARGKHECHRRENKEEEEEQEERAHTTRKHEHG